MREFLPSVIGAAVISALFVWGPKASAGETPDFFIMAKVICKAQGTKALTDSMQSNEEDAQTALMLSQLTGACIIAEKFFPVKPVELIYEFTAHNGEDFQVWRVLAPYLGVADDLFTWTAPYVENPAEGQFNYTQPRDGQPI